MVVCLAAFATQMFGGFGRIRAQHPLFESLDPLELRFEAPFRRMIAEQEGRFEARIIFGPGPSDTISVEVAPRGKSRLRSGICDFPGLMLFFEGGTVGSPFADQTVLPMVTHCKDRGSYEQLALLEYLAYRVYNVVTELSLRVRLAHVEYFDTEREQTRAERHGFFLEHWDRMADRNGWSRLRIRQIPPDEYEPMQRSLFEVFQYFIGNTDWSYAFPSPDEEECCHNSVPVGSFGGSVFPVPFDLDHSGLVDAPYATTDPSLPIRGVRERLFRGMCGSPAALNAAIGTFEVYREEIQGLFEESDLLSGSSRALSLEYVAGFFDLISNDRGIEREFLSKCRAPEF